MFSETLRKVVFACVALVALCSNAAKAQELQLNAYVDRSRVIQDQQFDLVVEFTGEEAGSVPQPEPANLERFASYLGTSSSMSTQIVNSQITISRSFTHHYVATTVGKFQIPAMQVIFKGKTYSSAPIQFEVIKGGSGRPGNLSSQAPDTPANNDDLSDALFLEAAVDKKRVYQNEPVVVTYRIYTAVNINSYGISQLPNTVGFWSEEFPSPKRAPVYDEIIKGRQYRVAEIKKIALFPQGPGAKTLDPMMIECEVQLSARRQRRDLFDSFFDNSFFSRGRTVTRRIRSNTVSIEVIPLPQAGKPADFSGAVGDFSLTASVDKNEVKTNEAITLKVNLSGYGNIKILPQPKIEFPTDFEVYDPKISEKINRDSDRISGSKTLEYVLIPRFEGKQTLKPLSFSYFDVSSRSYKRLSTKPIEINVKKGTNQFANVPMATSKEDVKLIGQDIRFIQTRLPEFHQVGVVFYKRWPFFLSLVLPLLILGAALRYGRYLDKMSSNVAYARSKKANQMALRRLRNASRELKEGDSRRFYSEVAKALMGFVGDKLNESAAALMTDEVDSVLRGRGIQAQTIESYLDCIKTCDFKRFAPGDSDNGEMARFFEKARKALIELDKEI